MGYATAFACLFTSQEMFVKLFGGLLLVKFTWLISEQF